MNAGEAFGPAAAVAAARMDSEAKQASGDGASDEKFLHIPYGKRWEYLRSTILRLYLEEDECINTLVERMKSEYSFAAQYVIAYRLSPPSLSLPTYSLSNT